MTESPTASMGVTGIAAPLLFGSLINWALYGVLCVQIYVYNCNFPRDRRSLKFLVYFVFLLETVQTVLTGADVYYWFVAGFGDVGHLENSHFAPIDIPIILALISLIVQGHFCYRIWTLNRWTSWICWIIAVAAVTQSVAATCSGIKSLVAGKYVINKTELYLWSVLSALADILITVAMTLVLRRARGKFSSFVLIRVVRLTIETYALTASLAIAILVLYVAFPDELYYISVTQIIGKVYSNTFLVSLNNRICLREHELRTEHSSSTYITTFNRNRVRATAVSPICFAEPESQPRTIGDNIELCTITQTVGLGQSKDDYTSIKASPSISRKCHFLPDDPERSVDRFPSVDDV
ncbi:hypothetical protein V8E53_001308 [Lactarius tabidus]